MTDWLEFLDINQNRFEEELMEFVRIPSVFSPVYKFTVFVSS